MQHDKRKSPAGNGALPEDQAGGRSTPILVPDPDSACAHEVVSRFRDAYAVVVIGKATRRHVFFGLPAAERAVKRAHDRGDYAELVLVQLVPVTGGAA